ncbi:hypothetical protein [Costertonia aggregata]|uniref:Uncharacterized protein n=1 Tax=Costertonia aggregata TaxID=343403 RepID=A0A7H9AJJ6_9FLAO|nr:hypothetical protein [Costertonia aggregata]QLG43822.1 hypothetical protein HYG79_00135 [Costertonia aggregata]
MPLHLDSFKNNQQFDFNYNVRLEGLPNFIKSLEKHLFSNVVVRSVPKNDDVVHLVIEAHCNFELSETVAHINNGIWGNTFDLKNTSFFLKALTDLRSKNIQSIDIDEFTILLEDTSLIINKIYEQSIPDQLENILQELANNYIYLTKGETEVPFEIYVPVFEENIIESDATLIKIETDTNKKVDYFSFWGLYFYSQEDAVIYDLANKSIVYADLYMLNH